MCMGLPNDTRALLRGAGRVARADNADGLPVGVEDVRGDGSRGATVRRLGDARSSQLHHHDDASPEDALLSGHEALSRPRLRVVPQAETVGPGADVSAARSDGTCRPPEVDQTGVQHLDSSAHLPGTTAETPAKDPVSRARDNYVPKGMTPVRWALVREVTREVVTRCEAASPYEAKQLMIVVARYFDHQTYIAGHPLDPAILLRRDMIVAYGNHLSATTAMSPATLGTYRSRLLRVADDNIGHLQPSTRMPGFRVADGSTPYTDAEVRAVRAWVDCQPSEVNRVDFNLLCALSLGAGLRNAEVIRANASHVTVDDEGVLVHVPGDKPRTVPVLAEWESVIADIAQAAWKPDMYLFRPRRKARTTNVLCDLLYKAPNKPFPINVGRLRATWIVTHLTAQTPVQALLDAAGIETLGALGRFYDHVPKLESRAARSALTLRARSEGCRASVSGHPLMAVDDE